MGFIDDVAKWVAYYAPKYDIKVYSPIIAQAILESASGTSELAKNANNYHGLKYKESVSELAPYYKIGSEQLADGSYVASAMKWSNFSSLQKGIEGYFKFISSSRYDNLKNVTVPKTYLTNIKNDGYATSLKYVDNLMAVIKKYNLTKYDPAETVNEKRYYRVQVGAYSSKANAESMSRKLALAGFKNIVKQYGNLYKVQCGAYSMKSNADNLRIQVLAKGFSAVVVYC